MSGSAVDVSVVLPAYNEAATLESTVQATCQALDDFDRAVSYEVIITEDGCTDETPAVAERLADAQAAVRHLHSDERLGRGRALERALAAANGDIFVYFDTDLATDLVHLEALVDAIRDEGAAIATGSRRLPDSDADRPLGRALPSGLYNTVTRLLFRSAVYDHQCGFKAFDREVLERLIDDVDATHWFWDTEVLLRAQAGSYAVVELPVSWTPRGESTVDVPRDAFRMGSQLLTLWWRLRLKPVLRRYQAPIALLITLVLGYLVLRWATEPEAILDEIAAMDPLLLAMAGVVYLASWPIRGLRYRDILRYLGFHERVGFLTGAVFVSQMGNLLVPARAGDAVRAYIVKARRDVPYATGFASLAVERIFDLLTITMLAAGVVVGLLLVGGPGTLDAVVNDAAVGGGQLAVAIAVGVSLMAIIGFALLLLSARLDDSTFARFAPREDSRFGRVIDVLARFLLDIRSVATRPTAFAAIGTTSLAIWSLDVLTAALVLAAFGVDITTGALLVTAIFAVSIGNLAKIVPLSPGGIGLYEAGFAIVIVGLTPIPVSVAIAAAIIDHALKNVITAIGGVLSAGWLNVSLVTAVREGRAKNPPSEMPMQE